MNGASPTIRVAAAVLVDDGGRMLVVRKRGTHIFMQPGGKIDEGESPLQALRRELQEEVALELDADDLTFAGVFTANAANEPDAMVEAHTFVARHHGEVSPAAEIEVACWVEPDGSGANPLADLTVEHMLPLAREFARAAL